MRTRERHYVISLQRNMPGEGQYFSTARGKHFGNVTEDEAFQWIWRNVCKELSEESGRVWNADNTVVLFYRLVKPR